MIFFVLRGPMVYFCPERLRDSFCPKRLHDFFCFVPRDCVIFFVPRRCMIFFVPRGVMIFFVWRGCVIFFCLEKLHDFFVPRDSVIYFVPRGCEFPSSQFSKFPKSQGPKSPIISEILSLKKSGMFLTFWSNDNISF